MSKTLAASIVALAVVGFFAFTLIMGYVGFQNQSNGYENGIKAQYAKNQNVYDNGYKEVLEISQVSSLYAEDLGKVYKDALEGRYGDMGSQAVLQFITEQNPNLDSGVYKKIQQSVEIFRTAFAQEQTQLVARKQEYANFLTTQTSSRFYNWIGAGYPKIDLAKYDIVTSGRTDSAFTTKKDEPLTLRAK